jgi:hypothetical protein
LGRPANGPGRVYLWCPVGEREASIRRAIACFREALRFWTATAAPHRYAGAQYHLGMAYMMPSVNQPVNLWQAVARLGAASDALLTLEIGKTRLSAEALRLDVPSPATIPDAVWTVFEEAGQTIRAIQSSGIAGLREAGPHLVDKYALRQRVARAADAALDAAIERVRESAPDFLKAMDLAAIQDLLPDERTALVTFTVTRFGSIGCVMHRGPDEAVRVVDVPTFTETQSIRLLGYTDPSEGRTVGLPDSESARIQTRDLSPILIIGPLLPSQGHRFDFRGLNRLDQGVSLV